jgi:hypothetical protein
MTQDKCCPRKKPQQAAEIDAQSSKLGTENPEMSDLREYTFSL